MSTVNLYGDQRILASPGYGVDVSSQRLDELDNAALEHIRQAASKDTLFRPRAMDLGCGFGGMANQMAAAGASVIAVDISHIGMRISHKAVVFIKGNICRLNEILHASWLGSVDAIVSQRTIHYLTYIEAVAAVRDIGRFLSEEGKLFISASGLGSELSFNYGNAGSPLCTRFAPLSPDMAERHGIRGYVCLYSENDMCRLLEEAGLVPERIYSSPFGNVKAIARKA